MSDQSLDSSIGASSSVVPTTASVSGARRSLLRWSKTNLTPYWWRSTRDPYALAVVEILLKQTRARTSAAQIRCFLEQYPNPPALAEASSNELLAQLTPFGFQRQRAEHLSALAKRLVEEPQALERPTEELRTLPGIGPYAASAISVFAHGRRETVIDVNVVRIFSRMWSITVPRGELRKSARIKQVAGIYAQTTKPREANWALLDLGASICVARSPHCTRCPLLRQCSHAASLPDLAAR